jgi:hypothetical protein
MRSGSLARIVPPTGDGTYLIFGRAVFCLCVPSNTQLILAAGGAAAASFSYSSLIPNSDPREVSRHCRPDGPPMVSVVFLSHFRKEVFITRP